MEGFAAKKRRQDKYTQQINMIDVDDTQETKTPSANDTIVFASLLALSRQNRKRARL